MVVTCCIPGITVVCKCLALDQMIFGDASPIYHRASPFNNNERIAMVWSSVKGGQWQTEVMGFEFKCLVSILVFPVTTLIILPCQLNQLR